MAKSGLKVAAWTATGMLAAVAAGRALAMAEPSAAPSFTQAQVTDGAAAYAKSCAMCHGASLEGAAGPALGGNQFQKAWVASGLPLHVFYDRTAKTMPYNAPGSLSEAQNLAITAFVLARNGYAPGASALQVADLDRKLDPAPAGAGRPPVVASGPKPSSYPAAPANPQMASNPASGPDDADILKMKDAEWLTYNRTLAGDRFSPLTQINVGNAAKLQPKCMVQFGEIGSFQASPIVRGDRMYVSSPHKTMAVNAATCATLWSQPYTPTGPEHIASQRGVVVYRGVVYRGTTDAHLLAYDAMTGKLLWDAPVADADGGTFLSAAPVAFDGKIFIGEGGGDHGINGHIHAFDAITGKRIWTFNVTPAPGEPGAETWADGADHGGGSSWSTVAIDPARKLVFAPTGNPGPDFNAAGRKGDNLYTDSVLALDMNTGKLAWYVQQVPGDIHDWDTAAAPALYSQGGTDYMAVASKDGYLYTYDRKSRKVLAKSVTMTRVNTDAPFLTDKPVKYCPGGLGQWNGPAYSPALKMTFVGSAERCDTLQLENPHYVRGQLYFGAKLVPDFNQVMTGWVRGFDAASGKQVWAYKSPSPITAAQTPTAGGLLMTGEATGNFLVFDAKTGAKLYSFYTGGGVSGGVSTYAVDGKQYVAVTTGNSSRGTWNTVGAATVVVFGLP